VVQCKAGCVDMAVPLWRKSNTFWWGDAFNIWISMMNMMACSLLEVIASYGEEYLGIDSCVGRYGDNRDVFSKSLPGRSVTSQILVFFVDKRFMPSIIVSQADYL